MTNQISLWCLLLWCFGSSKGFFIPPPPGGSDFSPIFAGGDDNERPSSTRHQIFTGATNEVAAEEDEAENNANNDLGSSFRGGSTNPTQNVGGGAVEKVRAFFSFSGRLSGNNPFLLKPSFVPCLPSNLN